jgi:hypothetical protein
MKPLANAREYGRNHAIKPRPLTTLVGYILHNGARAREGIVCFVAVALNPLEILAAIAAIASPIAALRVRPAATWQACYPHKDCLDAAVNHPSRPERRI